jgi:hypothetical protein
MAVDMNDKNVRERATTKQWASMFYQVMLSRRNKATTS